MDKQRFFENWKPQLHDKDLFDQKYYPKKSIAYAKVLSIIEKEEPEINAEHFLKTKYGDLYVMLYDLCLKQYTKEDISHLKKHLATFEPKLPEEETMFPDFYQSSIEIIKEVNDNQKTPSERLKLMADAFEDA